MVFLFFLFFYFFLFQIFSRKGEGGRLVWESMLATQGTNIGGVALRIR